MADLSGSVPSSWEPSNNCDPSSSVFKGGSGWVSFSPRTSLGLGSGPTGGSGGLSVDFGRGRLTVGSGGGGF